MAIDRTRKDVHAIIDEIMDAMSSKRGSHFSSEVYRDEPILVTGRQMAGYLPDEYKRMRSVSRWQPGEDGEKGRWLTESEFFYRQGSVMADFEDDCPYHGSYRASAPTYSSMSDRQLRGYFTWRSAARRGEITEAPAAFASLLAHELLCGIGTDDPLDGFRRLEALRDGARPFARGLDSRINAWLVDYVAYHGLDPELVSQGKATAFDRQLLALREARDSARAELESKGRSGGRAKKAATPSLGDDIEARLLHALDDLSVAPVTESEFYREHERDVNHVATATFLGMVEHCDKHRKTPYLADWFAEPLETPYPMFAGAVFFDPVPHEDAVVKINPLRIYRCRNGRWTCSRVGGGRIRSSEVSELLCGVIQRMERAYREDSRPCDGPEPSATMPKYLQALIDREIAGRLAWNETHAPRTIDIDLSKLLGIRTAAEQTREALLIDEEREGSASTPLTDSAATPSPQAQPPQPRKRAAQDEPCEAPRPAPLDPAHGMRATAEGTRKTSGCDAMLDAAQAGFLRDLLDGRAPTCTGASADMMADAINEALFDLVGDSVVEFGACGPQIIEDYREDVEGFLA